MFLENYCKYMDANKKYSSPTIKFAGLKKYWANFLTERVVRLFVWTAPDVDEKEIEIITMLNGVSAVVEYAPKKLGVFNGEFAGAPTIYYDEYKQFSVYSPIYSKVLKIEDLCLINNTKLRNSIYPLINRYATLLAHSDITLIFTLVNARESGGTPVATRESELKSIKEYYNDLTLGKINAIRDPAFLGVEFKGVNRTTSATLGDLTECIKRILESFYNDIGVKTTHDKKGNMIVDEVNANDTMLLLNISDMLNERKKAVDRINKKFRVNWSVKLADEIQYIKQED